MSLEGWEGAQADDGTLADVNATNRNACGLLPRKAASHLGGLYEILVSRLADSFRAGVSRTVYAEPSPSHDYATCASRFYRKPTAIALLLTTASGRGRRGSR